MESSSNSALHVVDQDAAVTEAEGVASSSDLPIALRKGVRKDIPQPARYRDILPCPPPSLPPQDLRKPVGHSLLLGARARQSVASESLSKQALRSPRNSFGLIREYFGEEFPEHDPEEHLQFGDLCTRISKSSLPPHVSPAAPPPQFFPYPNRSSFLLGDWYWNDGTQKTQTGFQNLVRIIADPEFVPADVLHNKWDRINAVLGGNQTDDDGDWADAADEGWTVSQIKITVPFHAGSTHPGPKVYEGVHLYHRSLVTVMKERVSDPQYFRHFHVEPYRLLWQPLAGAAKPEHHVHGEVYTSRAFLRAHRELLGSPQEPGCVLPRVICAYMFWSDATHLTSFGNTKLWPLYVFFGNESKYRRGKPSLNSCNHVAYFERVRFKIPPHYYVF